MAACGSLLWAHRCLRVPTFLTAIYGPLAFPSCSAFFSLPSQYIHPMEEKFVKLSIYGTLFEARNIHDTSRTMGPRTLWPRLLPATCHGTCSRPDIFLGTCHTIRPFVGQHRSWTASRTFIRLGWELLASFGELLLRPSRHIHLKGHRQRHDNCSDLRTGCCDGCSSAEDVVKRCNVAIKKIHKPFGSLVLCKRTYRELKLLMYLQHDNVRARNGTLMEERCEHR